MWEKSKQTNKKPKKEYSCYYYQLMHSFAENKLPATITINLLSFTMLKILPLTRINIFLLSYSQIALQN